MENNQKLTAVEWLGNEITNRITRRNPHDTIIIQILGETLIELIEQAKEMEKKQIEQAFEIGADSYYDLRQPSSCIQYYNETYGCNK